MHHLNQIDVLYTHTEGEPTCMVFDGIAYPHGADIFGQRQFLQENYDWLRKALLREPRGHQHMFGVFVTPSPSADADAGAIWMDGENFIDMCGHGTLALGMLMHARRQRWSRGRNGPIRFDTPVGRVTAETGGAVGSVDWCRFENVPAFVSEQNVAFELPGHGSLKADIAFGGNYFATVEWTDASLPINPDNGSAFSELGRLACAILRKTLTLANPLTGEPAQLNFVTFWHKSSRPDARYRCVHVFSDGKCDRSPGGTGTSAMMAMFEARGQLKIGEPIRSEGLLGSGTFEGCLIQETKIGRRRAVVPTIKGSAHFIGQAQWTFDENDPLRDGFVVR